MALAALTREQMLDRCDLAGTARVVAVGRDSPDSPNLAKLKFLRVIKGAPREGFVFVRLHGSVAPQADSAISGWSDWWDYPVGAVVSTHLDWNGAEEVFETTWPGAVRELHDAALAEVA